MLQWFIDLINSIFTTFGAIFNLFKSAIDGLISLLKMLPVLITDMTTAVGLLPTVLVTFFSISLTVTIIYLVLGRGKGGD